MLHGETVVTSVVTITVEVVETPTLVETMITSVEIAVEATMVVAAATTTYSTMITSITTALKENGMLDLVMDSIALILDRIATVAVVEMVVEGTLTVTLSVD